VVSVSFCFGFSLNSEFRVTTLDRIQWFLDEIDKHNPNNFFNGIAFDLDKRYAVTTFAEEQQSLTWALIHYCIGSIPVMKTDIPSQEYPGETFEVWNAIDILFLSIVVTINMWFKCHLYFSIYIIKFFTWLQTF
jgi:hypothetical protein